MICGSNKEGWRFMDWNLLGLKEMIHRLYFCVKVLMSDWKACWKFLLYNFHSKKTFHRVKSLVKHFKKFRSNSAGRGRKKGLSSSSKFSNQGNTFASIVEFFVKIIFPRRRLAPKYLPFRLRLHKSNFEGMRILLPGPLHPSSLAAE